MIELPRAALLADEIARQAEFFSFGTNDLTQTVLGLSRDDAGKFLPYYIEQGIMKYDPFVVMDQLGVGQLVETGVKKGRAARPSLKIGICGEHGGEPQSVGFFHRAGLDYVSCSPQSAHRPSCSRPCSTGKVAERDSVSQPRSWPLSVSS